MRAFLVCSRVLHLTAFLPQRWEIPSARPDTINGVILMRSRAVNWLCCCRIKAKQDKEAGIAAQQAEKDSKKKKKK